MDYRHGGKRETREQQPDYFSKTVTQIGRLEKYKLQLGPLRSLRRNLSMERFVYCTLWMWAL
jgi:hypothetical protein